MAAEKLSIVQETYESDAAVSLVARRHGVALHQPFRWRKLAAQGALTATSAPEEVVAASDYPALLNQTRELQRLLGKRTLEAEILKEALEVGTGPKKRLLRSLSWPKEGSRCSHQGDHRQPADLWLPARSLPSDASGPRAGSGAAQPQAGLPSNENSWPVAPAPCRWHRAPTRRAHCHGAVESAPVLRRIRDWL